MGDEKRDHTDDMIRIKKDKDSPVNIVTMGMGQSRIVQVHGEAASQIIQAYNGRRYDSAGNEIAHHGRSLKGISEYKINSDPQYAEQNRRQQAGFCAELLEEANQNHDAILRGDSTRRRTTDGIGRKNDPQYDHVSVDEAGNVTDPSQMKFLGVDQKGRYTVIEKLAKDASWDRYDCPIDVPKDQYQGAVDYANAEAEKHFENARRLRELGKTEKAEAEQRLAERYKSAGKRIRASTVTEEEAYQARVDAKKYVAKSLLSDAHHAGKEAAKGAVLISGAVSLAHNACRVLKGETTVGDAAKDTAVSTGKAGATAYGVAAVGSTLKSGMHVSKYAAVRKLGTTQFPTMVVTTALELSDVVKSYALGEIDNTQALARLGKSGVGTVASGYGAAVGSLLLPGVGTVIGSMVGYMVSSSIYDACLDLIVEADLARENYERTAELCRAARYSMEQQRLDFEAYSRELLGHRQLVMDETIPAIMDSIESADTVQFTQSISALAGAFGKTLTFCSFEEFDEFMNDPETVLKF